MNNCAKEIRPVFRILAGILSGLFLIGLVIEVLIAETKSWAFILSGFLILIIFLYVSVYGKVPKLLGALRK